MPYLRGCGMPYLRYLRGCGLACFRALPEDRMPNYVRWREPGATYFFTIVTYSRAPILTTDSGRRLLREAIAATRNRWPFEMPVSVLLPDHLHCLWTLPAGDDDFPTRISRLFIRAGGAEQRTTIAQRDHRRRGIWQPRYWEHRIRDADDYRQHRDYIHFNPVKHGYATPETWLWSTVHEHPSAASWRPTGGAACA